MSKRTVIKADEELVIKGKLTIEGNVTQIETTHQVTNLEGNIFTINSDGTDTSAVLALNSNGTVATMTFDDAVDKLVVNKTIVISAFGNIETTGNVNAGWFHGDGSNITGLTTSIVSEGANLYFTQSRVRGNISVADAGGDGSLTYSSANGVITYIGPNQDEANARIDSAPANVRAHLSATDGLSYNSTTGVFTLTNTTAGAGLIYTSGVLDVVAGDGITVNPNNVAVDSTVVRTSGNQSIAGNKTFTGTTYVTGNIEPTVANTYSLGTWANHFDYVFANTIHAERLDLSDANISDIHNSFYVGTASNASITRSGNGLTFTHNTTGAYYKVNAGDGLQISGDNVAVNSTVIRTTGDQTITGNTTMIGNLSITGNLDVTANINSLTVVDLLVQDSNIVLRSNAVSDANAMIIVERGNVDDTYIIWDAQSDAWKFSNDGTIEFPIPTSTTDLIEGSNLYFTTGRVNTAIDAYVIGGNGLTYSSGTLEVGAGDGITVNTDNVAVDATVIRTTGDQNIAGVKHFTGELVIPTSVPTSNNSIYVNAGNTAVFAYVNGVHVQLTADSDVGQVEDVGNTGINIYAGAREVMLANTVYYHGIKSIDAGNYLSIAEASNVITVSGNASAIRGLISATGNISYDSANGIISENLTTTDIDEGNNLYFTAARARGNISGTGLISYDSANGVISTSADNYNSWSIQTDSGAGSKTSISSNHTLNIIGTNGVTVTNTGNTVTVTGLNADITGVTAGNGLVGGGSAGAVTLDVAAGAGITVNADNVAVDQSYFDNTAGGTGWTGNLEPSANNTYSLGSPTKVWKHIYVGANSIRLGNTTISSTANVLQVANANVLTENPSSDTYTRSLLSIIDTGGDGSLSYNNANGVITYVGPSQTDANIRIDAHLSGTNGIDYSSGVISLSSSTGGAGLTYTSGVLAVGAGAGITVNADNVALSTSGVVSGSYGNASAVSYIIVDTYGRVTNASNTSISITSSQVNNFNAAIDAYLVGGNGLTYSAGNISIGAGAGITVNADNIALTSGVVTAGTYGGLSNSIPSLTVDTYGRVTGTSNTAISITTSQISNFTTAANTAIDNRIVGGSGLTYSSGTLAVGAGNYITVGADDVSVDATSTNTASKVVARDASGNFAANVITATATSARYADLAENYQADAPYAPGTVLVFGGEFEVTESVIGESTRVAGVVTTNPAHVMNSGLVGPNVVCIALRGRVPVKVKGIVRKGDVIVTSGEGYKGCGVISLDPKNVPAAAIIGKAVVDKLDPGVGLVEVLV